MQLFNYILSLILVSQPCLACFGGRGHSERSADYIHEHIYKRNSSLPSKTAITNVRVFDGHVMTPPRTIIINNGLIFEVSDVNHGTMQADVVVDGTDKFLIPGLIDSHIHIDSVSLLETVTSFGVTTAMNMACFDNALCAALANITGLASFLTATREITVPGSAHGNQTSPSQLLQPGEDPAQFVDESFQNSTATYLKIIAEPGGPTQEQQNISVAAAHQLGYYSVTHASYEAEFIQAVTSLTDGIQHIAADNILPQSIIAEVRNQRQFVTPTMTIFRVGVNDVRLRQLLHNNPDWSVINSNVRALHDIGVPLLAGTDSADLPPVNLTMPFGIGLHCELEFLVGAGLSTVEALRAATVVPTRIQGLKDRGSILPGMRADLVLLNSNPLVNISNSRDIARVWVGGVEYGSVKKDLTQICLDVKLETIGQ
jgi:imidazolonepropionase-like amidohydrolase